MQVLLAFGIASEKSLIIDDIQTAAVDRAPEEVAAIYRVAQVLQDRQLRLHEDLIAAIVLVAHHAVLELDVAHIIVVYGRVVPYLVEHFDGDARQPTVKHLGNVAPHQQALIKLYVERRGVCLVDTAAAPNG